MSWGGKARARFRRASQVMSVLGRFGFSWVLHEADLPRVRHRRMEAEVAGLEMPERLRRALLELGGTAIKLGQLLASRPDLVPAAYVAQLRELQDNVPPQSFEDVQQVIREELGGEVDELFDQFEREPRASASIGQVHFARLADGTPVAVKVQRLGVAESVELDLDLMLWAARRAEKSVAWAAENRILQVAQNAADTIRQELNFLIEAHNTRRLKDNLAEEAIAYVPAIYWNLTTRRVLVVEWVEGAKVGQQDDMATFGVDTQGAANNMLALMLRQILRDGFFHGDPHAGNVLFPGGETVAFIDCGNAVSIDRSVREHLVSLVVAVLNDDAQEVTDYVLALGATSERTDLEQLTTDIGRMISYYSGFKSSAQIGLGQLLNQLLELVVRHGVRMQPSLAAIAKSLIVTEGICLGLDPQFDAQDVLRQELKVLVAERLKPKRIGEEIFRMARSTSRYAQSLPRQVNQVLQRMQGGGIRMRIWHENIDRPLHRLDLMVNRIAFALVVAAVIMSSTNLVTSERARGPLADWLTVIYLFVGLILGGWLLFSILRSGRF
ncbi:MAG: AarF/UbiB family protein [Armatimonadia bacterium]